MDTNNVHKRWFPSAPEKPDRHRGKVFEFDFQEFKVLALCVGRDQSMNYLLKWYNIDTSLDAIDIHETRGFKHKYIELDREIRRKNTRIVKRFEEFDHPWPDLWAPGGSFTIGESDTVALIHQFTYEWVSIFDHRLNNLSLQAISPIDVIKDDYVQGRSASKDLAIFRQRTTADRAQDR